MKSFTIYELHKFKHHDQVRFAVFAAKKVLHLARPQELAVATKAIEVVELWLDGKATAEECEEAAYVVWAANAVAAAAISAAGVVAAAIGAASAAAANAAGAVAVNATGAAANATTTAAADAAYWALRATKSEAAKAQLSQELWNYYEDLLYFEERMLEALKLTSSSGH